jgi:hypothetical protein
LVAFAFFKLLVFTLTAAVFFYFSKEFLRARAYDMFKAIIAPAVLPCGLLLCAYLFVVPRMPLGKSNLNFVISVSTIAAVSVAAVALYCFFSRGHRELLTELYARLVKA